MVESMRRSMDTSAWMMEYPDPLPPSPKTPLSSKPNDARTEVTERAHAVDLRRLHHLAPAPACAAPPLAAAALLLLPPLLLRAPTCPNNRRLRTAAGWRVPIDRRRPCTPFETTAGT